MMVTDAQIQQEVMAHIKWNPLLDASGIGVFVKDGVVTLEGEVVWEFQREAVRYTVTQLPGVRRMVNHICLRKTISQKELKQKISDALCRSAMLDAEKIEVEIKGTQAILKGIIRLFSEKEDAGKAAWEYPGILFVENFLELECEHSVGLYASDLSF